MKTIGNFLTQPNRNFPVDCETFSYLQDNIALVSILGNIAGDKAILSGCELEKGNSERGPGYIFVRTKLYPAGEILYWQGGAIGSMCIQQTPIAISAQNNDYPAAYTTRTMAPGIGDEIYQWADFKDVKNCQQLDQLIRNQNNEMAQFSRSPLGVVEMWSGDVTKIPHPYCLCDGSMLHINQYPGLFAAIGNIHGGDKITTFALPDLRSRFIVGYNSSDADYKTIGQSGGLKKCALTTDELPAHSHVQNTWTQENARFTNASTYSTFRFNPVFKNTMTQNGNTSIVGKGMAHENRPPYYVMAYIMRAL